MSAAGEVGLVGFHILLRLGPIGVLGNLWGGRCIQGFRLSLLPLETKYRLWLWDSGSPLA